MRRLAFVLVAFGLTRALVGYVADHPGEVYPAGSADPTTDISLYVVWSNQMQDFDNRPYRDFDVEYPPGSVAIANVPYIENSGNYRTRFIVMSALFDAAGLWAIYRMSRRRGSWWGVVAWLVLLPLLGPVAYTRLDMAVAACLAWAFERIDAGGWGAAGFWLGLGTAIKITPGLLLPAIVLAAPRRWRPAVAAVVPGAVLLVPFLTDLPDLWDQVIGYHVDRGVHHESLWGSLALLARVLFDADVGTVAAYGASDIVTTYERTLRILSNLAAAGVLVDSVLAATRRVRRSDGAHLVLVAGSALILLTAVGRVFSPQYLVWLAAPMAAMLAIAPRALRWSALLLGLATVLAHVVFPWLFFRYIEVEGGAVAVGVVRNLALLGAGLLAVRAAWRYRDPSGSPAVEQHQGVESVDADVLVGPHR